MERRINNIVDEHLIGFKKECNKAMSVVMTIVCEDIIAYIYNYNKLTLSQDDLLKKTCKKCSS